MSLVHVPLRNYDRSTRLHEKNGTPHHNGDRVFPALEGRRGYGPGTVPCGHASMTLKPRPVYLPKSAGAGRGRDAAGWSQSSASPTTRPNRRSHISELL